MIKKNSQYKKEIIKKVTFLCLLLVVLFLSLLLSLFIGASDLSFMDTMKAFFHKDDSINSLILYELRLPRIIIAILVGGGLSIAGCIMQSTLKNNLASPSTLGVSQGASFGAAVGIVVMEEINGISTAGASNYVNPYIVTLLAFFGGIATATIILLLSRFKKLKPSSMVLVGVALSSLFSGGLSLAQYFASENALGSIVFWTLGDLGRVDWDRIGIVGIIFVIMFVIFMINSWKFNAMEQGLDTAKSLGIHVELLTVVSMLFAAILASVSVAFVGIINFIGLVAPHIARRIVGNNYAILIPTSAVVGGIILVLADLAGRMILTPIILPIGAITSFLGAPLFLYLIFREKSL